MLAPHNVFLTAAMESTPEYRASVAVWRYCPPVLFAFGTFGNLMTIVILRRMNMKRSAMPVYLTALAISDTLVLYTGLLRRWIMYVFDVDLRTLYSGLCKVHTWLVYSSIYVSAWILTFMTLERMVSVLRPHHVSLLCTRTKAFAIVIVIVVTALLSSCHLLYGVGLVERGNSSSVECEGLEGGYQYFFDVVWSWADLTLSSLIPFTVLLVGNCFILWKVSLSVRAMRYLGSVRPHDVKARKKTASSMTITLVALSVIFFLTTSPICVYNIIEHYVEDQDDPRGMARLMLAWAVVNILMYINSTVNFYLYCLSGTRFRQELFRCLACRPSRRRSRTKNVDIHILTNHTSENHDNNHHHNNHQNAHHHADAALHPTDEGKDVTDSISQRIHNRLTRSMKETYMYESTEF